MQPDEYNEMQRFTHNTDKVFQVEMQMRFVAMTRRLRQLIKDGAIGNLIAIHAINMTP